MYNIHTPKKYREAAIYKENESLYYFPPLIPSLPVPTPASSWRSAHINLLCTDCEHSYSQVTPSFLFRLCANFRIYYICIFCTTGTDAKYVIWGLTQITQRQHDLCIWVLTCWFLWLLVTRCLSLALYGDCLNYQQSEADCCHNIFWPKFLVVI